MAVHDLAAVVAHCAHELVRIGDELYWGYKLLDILIRNYRNYGTFETVTKIK